MSRTLLWLTVVTAIWSPGSANAGTDSVCEIAFDVDNRFVIAVPGEVISETLLHPTLDLLTIELINPQTNSQASTFELATGPSGIDFTFVGEPGDSAAWSIEMVFRPDTCLLPAGQIRFGILGASTGDHPTEEVSWSATTFPPNPDAMGTLVLSAFAPATTTDPLVGYTTESELVAVELAGTLAADSTAGVRIQSLSFTLVPEPSSLHCGLVGVGILGWIRRGRFRNRK